MGGEGAKCAKVHLAPSVSQNRSACMNEVFSLIIDDINKSMITFDLEHLNDESILLSNYNYKRNINVVITYKYVCIVVCDKDIIGYSASEAAYARANHLIYQYVSRARPNGSVCDSKLHDAKVIHISLVEYNTNNIIVWLNDIFKELS